MGYSKQWFHFLSPVCLSHKRSWLTQVLKKANYHNWEWVQHWRAVPGFGLPGKHSACMMSTHTPIPVRDSVTSSPKTASIGTHPFSRALSSLRSISGWPSRTTSKFRSGDDSLVRIHLMPCVDCQKHGTSLSKLRTVDMPCVQLRKPNLCYVLDQFRSHLSIERTICQQRSFGSCSLKDKLLRTVGVYLKFVDLSHLLRSLSLHVGRDQFICTVDLLLPMRDYFQFKRQTLRFEAI